MSDYSLGCSLRNSGGGECGRRPEGVSEWDCRSTALVRGESPEWRRTTPVYERPRDESGEDCRVTHKENEEVSTYVSPRTPVGGK